MTRVASVLAMVTLLSSAVVLVMSPRANAQLSQWSGTENYSVFQAYQGAASQSKYSDSGSGQFNFALDSSGNVTGLATFQGTVSITGSSNVNGVICEAAGSADYSGQQSLTGSVQGSTATITSSFAIQTVGTGTLTCSGSGSVPWPLEDFAGGASVQFSIQLCVGCSYSYQWASPLQGSTSYTLTNQLVNSTTIETTTHVNGPVTLTYEGLVQVLLPGSFMWVAIPSGTAIPSDGVVRTSGTGMATFSFPDGTTIVIGANSQFIYIDPGTGVSKLSQGLLHMWHKFLYEWHQKFEVRTSNSVVAVRGTNFTIQVLTDNSTFVQVFEGSVGVTDLITNATVVLAANQEVAVPNTPGGVSQQSLNASVMQFDPSQVSQWWKATTIQTSSQNSATIQTVSTQATIQTVSTQATTSSGPHFSSSPVIQISSSPTITMFAVVLVVVLTVLIALRAAVRARRRRRRVP